MSIKLYCILLFLLVFSGNAYGQEPGYEYFVTVNSNLYLPQGKSGKGLYPILGFDKQADTKVLIGGFGLGISAFRQLKEKTTLKGQANCSKHTYWDEPVILTDENGAPAGAFQAGTSDYALNITALAHHAVSRKISVGAGLGSQVLLVSLARSPESHDARPAIMMNRYYKKVMPVLPLELSYKTQKHLINIRYEQGLLNRYRSALQASKKDNFGLLTFEVGFKIEQP